MRWEKLCRTAAKIQMAAFTVCGCVMVTLLTANGLGRYLLGKGFSWSDEIVRVMFVWGCFLGITSAFITDSHIGFDSFAKINRVTRRVSTIINGLCLIVIGIVVAIYGTQFTKQMGKFPLPASHWPIGILYSAGVVAGIVWIFIGVAKLIHAVRPEKKQNQEAETKA